MKRLILLLSLVFAFTIELFAIEYASKSQIKKMKSTYGERASKRLENWNNLMKKAEKMDEKLKVRTINAYFNQFRYVNDKYNWENIEYWASFGEFMGKGKGDCEDYALAKYYSLRKLGIPTHKLRLITGKLSGGGHLVLAYYANSNDPYILDNNNRYLVPLSKVSRFKAETYFNEENYGVIDSKIAEKRALFEYQYFNEWLSKNSETILW